MTPEAILIKYGAMPEFEIALEILTPLGTWLPGVEFKDYISFTGTPEMFDEYRQLTGSLYSEMQRAGVQWYEFNFPGYPEVEVTYAL